MAGRRSIAEQNKIREKKGLRLVKKTEPENKSILPISKKARTQEILAEMMGKKGKNVVQKVLNKALDDDDSDQMACLKLVMDRLLPTDYIQKMKGQGNQIQINITGIDNPVIESEPIDVDVEEANG